MKRSRSTPRRTIKPTGLYDMSRRKTDVYLEEFRSLDPKDAERVGWLTSDCPG